MGSTPETAPGPPGPSAPSPGSASKSSAAALALGALGVVFGDIGTSPLYALKQAFSDARGLTPNPGSVYGVLSLVFCSARARWGQDQPYVPAALQLARRKALDLDLTDATSFLSRVTVVRTKEPGMAGWRERLFCLIGRNAVSPAACFGLPAHQVVSLGSAIDI